jgi:hypothetical protein
MPFFVPRGVARKRAPPERCKAGTRFFEITNFFVEFYESIRILSVDEVLKTKF